MCVCVHVCMCVCVREREREREIIQRRHWLLDPVKPVYQGLSGAVWNGDSSLVPAHTQPVHREEDVKFTGL